MGGVIDMEMQTSEHIRYHRNSDMSKLALFQVFGERRSGTNFLRNAAARNLPLQQTREFGWKHGIPYMPVLPLRVLFMVIVRHPLDWAISLHKEPFEAAHELQNNPFSEFIRREWSSVYRPRIQGWERVGYRGTVKFKGKERYLGVREELQLDRHPISGAQYSNIFEMRTTKLLSHLSFVQRGLNVVYVRYEDLVRQEEAIIRQIAAVFDLKMSSNYRHARRVDPQNYPNRQHVKREEVLTEDILFIRSQLNLELEQKLDYAL